MQMLFRVSRLLRFSASLACVGAALECVCLAAPGPVQITVQAGRAGQRINPAMWGIFFEDINFGADGGLYAELVKNRSFEFPDAMMGWSSVTTNSADGKISIREDQPFNKANPHYLRVESTGGAGVSNEGYRGMGIKAGEDYDFSTQARKAGGSPSLEIELIAPDGKVLAHTSLKDFAVGWQKRTATLHTDSTEAKARLRLLMSGAGAVDLDMVSLFPRNTWKQRPGGLRADMVQLLADLHPGFLRFPGGCIVEGHWLTNRYQWKTTIGDVAERKLIMNRWNIEFKNRSAPDYYQSFGLGFFEFFQLCEDIGSEPLPILNCGMACQFNSGELVPMEQLDPYIRDALDLIEFANGPADSAWGAKRAAMGHPEPFHLKLLGVGNEQWGPQYIERYMRFAKALKEKHPEIQLISSAGPSPADDRFNFLWPKLRALKADIVDEHCYADPTWFLINSHRYDKYDRNGPKVFMGEYAAQSHGVARAENRNNWECALAEAAYMTGLERNSDVVRMASYAPLFGHIDAWQWTPNLIWTDNLRAFGTPNYYVQQVFSRNRGDVVLPTKMEGAEPPAVAAGRIGLGTYQTAAEFKDVRVTRGDETVFSSDFADSSKGWSMTGGRWSVKEGSLRQTDPRAISAAVIGKTQWKDYTLSLKARKIAGKEGFLIIVRDDARGARVQWNLGGWSNHQHGIQGELANQDAFLRQIPGSIETNRWYDIKLELRGNRLDCYLDGNLLQSADVPATQIPEMFVTAARDEKARDIIVKVVNAGPDARKAAIKLEGVKSVGTEASLTLLHSAGLDEVNSFEEPKKISPKISTFDPEGGAFEQEFPARSVSVLRVPAQE